MKRQSITLIALAVALAFGLPVTHAENEAKTRGEKGDALTPLAIGNTWVYASDHDDTLNVERIEGKVLFDGRPWYLLRTYKREKDQPEAELVSLDIELWLSAADGEESEAFAEFDDETGNLKLGDANSYYRYPVQLGQTYTPNTNDPATALTITALNESVTTQAGEFACVVYKETNTEAPGYSFTSWFAPGVGIIKFVTVEDGKTATSELIRYTLTKAE